MKNLMKKIRKLIYTSLICGCSFVTADNLSFITIEIEINNNININNIENNIENNNLIIVDVELNK